MIAADRSTAKIRHEIRHAHHLYASGFLAEASQAFIELAESARRQNRPQAPFLLLKSANAQIKLGQPDQAYSILSRSVLWLKQDQRWEAILKIGQNAAKRFEKAGFHKDSERVRGLLTAVLQEDKHHLSAPRLRASHKSFPCKCPYCGGTVDPDFNRNRVGLSLLCSYCGS
jgi:hypothetical protein